jgi:hypothetical protein
LTKVKYHDVTRKDTVRQATERRERADPTLKLKREISQMQLDRNEQARLIQNAEEAHGCDREITPNRYQNAIVDRQGIIDRDTTIAKEEEKLEEMVDRQSAYKPRLTVPRDRTPYEDFVANYDKQRRNIDRTDGVDTSLERSWKQILEAGESGDWSHEYYKKALHRVLKGEAFDFYETIKHKEIEEILKDLATRFGGRQMYKNVEELRIFTRKAGEQLDPVIKRMESTISRVLPLVRKTARDTQQEDMMIAGLFNIVSRSARAKMREIRAGIIQSGEEARWEDYKDEALTAELTHGDKPQVDMKAKIAFMGDHCEPQEEVQAHRLAIDSASATALEKAGETHINYVSPTDNNYGRSMSNTGRRSTSGRPSPRERADQASLKHRTDSHERRSQNRDEHLAKGRPDMQSQDQEEVQQEAGPPVVQAPVQARAPAVADRPQGKRQPPQRSDSAKKFEQNYSRYKDYKDFKAKEQQTMAAANAATSGPWEETPQRRPDRSPSAGYKQPMEPSNQQKWDQPQQWAQGPAQATPRGRPGYDQAKANRTDSGHK